MGLSMGIFMGKYSCKIKISGKNIRHLSWTLITIQNGYIIEKISTNPQITGMGKCMRKNSSNLDGAQKFSEDSF
jgi:hypothetical protein